MPKVPQTYLEARRDEILDAAWTCFARKGYHQTTMQDICRESELSAGAVYRYFAKKEDILRAINARSLEMGRRLVEDARAQVSEPLNSLWLIGETMLNAFLGPGSETMNRINIEIWPEIIRDQELREGVRAELTFWHSAVAAILKDAAERGQLKAGVDPEAAASLFMCAYEGLRHYRLVAPETFSPEVLIDLGHVLTGEGAPAEERPLARPPADAPGPPLGTHYPRLRRPKAPLPTEDGAQR